MLLCAHIRGGLTDLAKEPAQNEWTSQLRRGVLELCVLKMLRDESNYGYEIVTKLETLGPLAAGENTVYPLLRRLKTDRHLETFAVESPAGPFRQVLPTDHARAATACSA